MSKNKIEVKQIMETTEVIAYLEELLNCFKAGKIVVERGTDMISMDLPGTVKVAIAAKHKDNKGGFSLELGWKSGEPEPLEPVKISQCEPAAAEETVQETVEASREGGNPGHLTAKPESAPVATGSADDVVRREPSAPVKQEEPGEKKAEGVPETAETPAEPIPMPEAKDPEAPAEAIPGPEAKAPEAAAETIPGSEAKAPEAAAETIPGPEAKKPEAPAGEEKQAVEPIAEQTEEKAAAAEPAKAEPVPTATKQTAKRTAGRKHAAKKKTAP